MLDDLHIEDFYKDTGKIFITLYSSFPRKIELYVEDISGEDETDEFGLHTTRHMSCFSTMIWLGEAGYINFTETIRQEAIDQAVLSHKAFTLLTSRSQMNFGEPETEDDNAIPPSVLEESGTNIVKLKRAIQSRNSIFIRQCVQYLLRESRYHNY
jgi:hypothetical protein